MALLLAAVAAACATARAAPPRPPTPADFLAYPTCMIYAQGAQTRIRVRAARASSVCRALARQLSKPGHRWSPKPSPLRQILTPVCAFADPTGRIELQVMDAAADTSRGRRICASLARAGWYDLSPP